MNTSFLKFLLKLTGTYLFTLHLGLVCYDDESTIAVELEDLFLNTNVTQHEDCGEAWDYTYRTPPQNCHRVNSAMRDYLA